MQRSSQALALLLALSACTVPRAAAVQSVRDGMRVVEGVAPDGLRWRLWLPEAATPQHTLRLAVWLHPSRDSGEALIEPLAPLLAEHGYALLVPLKTDYLGWSSVEIKALFAHTLPEVARRPDIDARLPLVIGFSAGGQMALHLWQKAPEVLGGVVLIGTVPALVSDQTERPVVLPAPELVCGTAVLSLVGERERGAAGWTRVAAGWLAAGVPLTLKIVPARSHEWLIDEPERVLLSGWLDAIAESSTTPRPGG